ncbi:AraC family transcriptional regulator [Paenibacillus algorifonticola]|uniref:helix-turn-helix domain-containing protein n=1 Tax=Paenibacillus algorifonticola TaxID=684063 RepID=UPI003D2A42EE
MKNLIEFSNQSSLDHLNINVRWLKEWNLTKAHERLYIFPYTTFWIVLSGTAVIELNHIRHYLKKGDIVSIAPKTAQSWQGLSTDQPFHYLSLACEAKVGAMDFIHSYRFPYVVSDVPSVEVHALIEEWRRLADEYNAFLQPFDEKDIKSSEKGYDKPFPLFKLSTDQTIQHLKIRAKGMLWVQQLFQTIRYRLPDQPVPYDERVFEICDYVEKRLDKPPSLDDLATHVSLSKEQLRTLFQTTYGLSPMKYVRHARLQKARDLLMLTSYPIKDIASQIGFEDQHHFSRAFQQSEGMSPMAYRRRLLQGIKHE